MYTINIIILNIFYDGIKFQQTYFSQCSSKWKGRGKSERLT